MSCDWDIRCVDCGENHGFDDMNHENRAMLAIIRHADAIAGLFSLVQDPDVTVELVVQYRNRRVEPAFFKKHQGHRLRPVDEYGRLLGDCTERVDYPDGASHWCTLPDGHLAKGEPHR